MKLRILAAWFALVSLPVSAAENLRDYPDLSPMRQGMSRLCIELCALHMGAC